MRGGGVRDEGDVRQREWRGLRDRVCVCVHAVWKGQHADGV